MWPFKKKISSSKEEYFRKTITERVNKIQRDRIAEYLLAVNPIKFDIEFEGKTHPIEVSFEKFDIRWEGTPELPARLSAECRDCGFINVYPAGNVQITKTEIPYRLY